MRPPAPARSPAPASPAPKPAPVPGRVAVARAPLLALLSALLLSGCSTVSDVFDAGALPTDGTPIAVAATTDEGACTLPDAIRAANADAAVGGCPAGDGADVILLEPGSTIELTATASDGDGRTGLPSVASAIEIRGQGATLRRADDAPPFRLLDVAPEGSLTLRDLRLTGGLDDPGENDPGDDGAAGAIRSRGDLRLVRVAVERNEARGEGGAVGGVLVDGGRAALIDSVVVDNGSSCRLGCAGGIYLRSGELRLAGTSVLRNVSSGENATDGAGIRAAAGRVRIDAGSFEGNEVRSDDAGGAALAFGADVVAVVSDSDVGSHFADYGGAVFNRGTLLLLRTRVAGRGEVGGAVLNLGRFMAIGSVLSGAADSGGALRNHGLAVLRSSTLVGCGEAGGAIYNEGSLALIEGSRAEGDCEDGSWARGGVVMNRPAESGDAPARFLCRDSRLVRGRAEVGGGLYNEGSATVERCRIEENRADADGGGIFNRGRLDLVDAALRANVADADGDGDGAGGGVYLDGGAYGATDGTAFEGNRPDDVATAAP